MKSAREVFDMLVGRAYWWASNKMPSSLRDHTVKDWEPGKMVEGLSNEERDSLKELTSEQIAESTYTKEDAKMAAYQGSSYPPVDNYAERLTRESKLEFDKLIVKERPTADRKKY